MKNITILGSTGSIGQNTLSVVRKFPAKFRVVGISANSDIDKLTQQVNEFKPLSVCISDKDKAVALSKKIGSKVKVLTGGDGLEALAADKKADQVMLAVSGTAGLKPLISEARERTPHAVYRLRTQPAMVRTDAQALCEALMSRGIACYFSATREGDGASIE